jgi:hypothetical protein
VPCYAKRRLLPDSFSDSLNCLLNSCDCSTSVVGSGRSLPAPINRLLASAVLFTRSMIICFLLLRFSLPFQRTMGRGRRGSGWPRRADGKRKHAPSPPLKDFGDSEYSEETSSEADRSPAPASPPSSSEDSDDSMGLSTTARAYWRSIECAGLDGSDESRVSSDEADSLRSGAAAMVTTRATIAAVTTTTGVTTTRATAARATVTAAMATVTGATAARATTTTVTHNESASSLCYFPYYE